VTMKFITSWLGNGYPNTMGRQYMKVGRKALFGVRTEHGDNIYGDVPKSLSFLISRRGKLRHGELKKRFNRITCLVLVLLLLLLLLDESLRIVSGLSHRAAS